MTAVGVTAVRNTLTFWTTINIGSTIILWWSLLFIFALFPLLGALHKTWCGLLKYGFKSRHLWFTAENQPSKSYNAVVDGPCAYSPVKGTFQDCICSWLVWVHCIGSNSWLEWKKRLDSVSRAKFVGPGIKQTCCSRDCSTYKHLCN